MSMAEYPLFDKLYYSQENPTHTMFSLFKKKSKLEILQEKYAKLMSESHKLSTTNRSESDRKFAEAESLIQEMERLENLEKN